MSKKRNHKKTKTRAKSRKTNWPLIIGIVAVGFIGLMALLVLNQRPQEILTLAERCAEEGACITNGEADAPVKIIEVIDFGCTHCRTFHEETEPLIEQAYVESGDVQFIYYPYALSSTTLPAANAGMCAAEQESYGGFADAMFAQFEADDARERSGILRAGEAVGLDMDAFTTCVDDGRYDDVVQENIEVARFNRITSTPTFLINGREISGAFPFETFASEIEAFLN